METLITNDIDVAAKIILRGGLVAFPTETVYGLGANVFDEKALESIFTAKMRPPDNPLIVHIAEITQIDELSSSVNSNARRFIDKFFPGPLTLVLKKKASVPAIASAGLDTIGVRMPSNKIAADLLRKCGTPIAAPSANLSGKPSPTTWSAVFEDLDGRIDCILKGEPTVIGVESTVVDCSENIPVLLRKGSITFSELQRVVPETQMMSSDTNAAAKSPGLRHRHYSPNARVQIVEKVNDIAPINNSAIIAISEASDDFAFKKRVANVEEYAHDLYEFFRECDRRNIETIFCQAVAADGLGAALMDRLRRAEAR